MARESTYIEYRNMLAEGTLHTAEASRQVSQKGLIRQFNFEGKTNHHSHRLIGVASCWTTASSDEGTEVSRHPFSLRPQGSLTTLTGHPEAACQETEKT